VTAAATSSASSGSAAAPARPPEPRVAGWPRQAHQAAATKRLPSPDHRRGSPPPRPAPHTEVRPTTAGPFKRGERLPKTPLLRGF
jgi:hypothetical protein